MLNNHQIRELLIGACIATCGFIAVAPAVAQQPIEWRYFTYLGVNDRPTQENRAFAEDVLRATNGRLKITVFAAGELPYTVPGVLKAVASNQIQMGEVVVGGSGDVPEINVLQLPFLCTSYRQFEKALPVIQPFVEATLRKKFGVGVLIHWTMPPQNLWLTRPITKLEDLRGMKVRTWNSEQVDMMRTLGGSAISITSAEVIPALERKIIDGAITSSISANDWRAYELVSTGYMVNMTMGYELTTVNIDALNRLPAEVRNVLIAKAHEWAPKYMKMSEEGDIAARNNLVAHKVTLVEPSSAEMEKARRLMRPMWDRWAQKNGSEAQRQLDAVMKACGAS